MFAIGSEKFLPAHRRIFQQKSPEAGVGQGLNHVAQREIRVPISFPRESQYGIGPRFDASVDEASKMHAKKWKLGIGHRIDQTLDQILAIWSKLVVFTPKRNDLGGVSGASPAT